VHKNFDINVMTQVTTYDVRYGNVKGPGAVLGWGWGAAPCFLPAPSFPQDASFATDTDNHVAGF